MSDGDNNDKEYSKILRDNDRLKDAVKGKREEEEEEERGRGKERRRGAEKQMSVKVKQKRMEGLRCIDEYL